MAGMQRSDGWARLEGVRGRATPLAALALVLIVTAASSGCASASGAGAGAGGTWSVTETADPVTGVRRCVVAAFDRAASARFSRTGYLYPIVEYNSEHGLLVGVSTGGPYRLPAGDIVWRVDDRPFRTLRAADNPTSSPAAATTGDAMADAMALQQRLVDAMTATATVASGSAAEAMLAEMRAGRTLIFRAAAAAPAYGLPNPTAAAVGQVTSDGLRPIPLDASLQAGLEQCQASMP